MQGETDHLLPVVVSHVMHSHQRKQKGNTHQRANAVASLDLILPLLLQETLDLCPVFERLLKPGESRRIAGLSGSMVHYDDKHKSTETDTARRARRIVALTLSLSSWALSKSGGRVDMAKPTPRLPPVQV